MNQDTTFIYKYSVKENKEVQEIRNKYLPREESKVFSATKEKYTPRILELTAELSKTSN